MRRDELANKVYEIFKNNHKTYNNDVELWQVIAKASDQDLLDFIEDHKGGYAYEHRKGNER